MKNIISTLAVLFLISCYSESEEELFPEKEMAPPPDTVSYLLDVKPIIELRCSFSPCHDGNGAPWNLNDFNDLKSSIENSNSENSLLGRITTPNVAKRMPKGGPKLPQAEISIIRKWIEQGAKEN